jgi:hypothetical protein
MVVPNAIITLKSKSIQEHSRIILQIYYCVYYYFIEVVLVGSFQRLQSI